jgi:hypothetical protein
VQHRSTLTQELRHKPYSERIEKFNFLPIRIRRKRRDLIECFKLLKGLEIVDWGNDNNIHNVGVGESGRRHNYKIQREKYVCKQRHNFLLNRAATA